MPLASYITVARKLPFPQRRERIAILLLAPDGKVKHVHWAEGARRSVNVSLASIEGLPGSSSFVTVHNHPSGVLRPSPKDLEAATLTMSPLEQALQDSGRISDLALASLVVGESQSVDQALQAASNRQIVGHFIGNLAANERAALVGAAGELNTLGLQRLKAALFAKVYPGEAGHRLTKAFVESLDPVVKNMEAAMFDALAASAKAEGLIRAGDRVADLSLGEDVAKAVDMLARLKQTGTVASDYIRQTSAFGRELDPSQERLLVFLEANGRSRKVLREFLQEYAAAVVASPHPSQGSMFGGAGESKDAVVSRLIEAQTKKGSTGALFNLIAARQAVGFADPLRRGHWGGVTLSDIDVGGVHRGRTSISAA